MAGAGLTRADWLERVPDLLAGCCEDWGLQLGAPYASGAAGYAVRAALPDGTAAVLKLSYPDRETEHEAEALLLWDGDGAVRLLARARERRALLLERCEPGTYLSERSSEEALGVLIELLPRLWRPAGPPFQSLAAEAACWLESLPVAFEAAGGPFERPLLDAALEALLELPSTQGEQVLVHQDLHGENVLAAERESWLVIDPKPLVGEREFALAPIIRSSELGGTREALVHRLDRLTRELELDRERARRWAIGQTLAWGFGPGFHESHVQAARWLLQAE